VIVILWSRMGTPLPDNLRKPNGEPYLSGTEWEYEDAVNWPRQPRRQVLVYRRTEKLKLEIDDPSLTTSGHSSGGSRRSLPSFAP
jgi:hypothetical protein